METVTNPAIIFCAHCKTDLTDLLRRLKIDLKELDETWRICCGQCNMESHVTKVELGEKFTRITLVAHPTQCHCDV